MKVLKIILMCAVIVLGAVFFLKLVEKDTDISGKTLVHSDSDAPSEEASYYMKAHGGNIIVFNKDHTVYEYTDLQTEFLPENVVYELSHGIYFRNQEDLYEFLETYSS